MRTHHILLKVIKILNTVAVNLIPIEVDDVRGLSFIEDDRGTSIGSRGTSNVDYSCGQSKPLPETGSLLERTRAVAQYIKEKSAAMPSTSENAGSVGMKSSLVGKTRTVCSQLFFETLVLKSCDLVDVKQDEPYGDITLIVTPKPQSTYNWLYKCTQHS